MEKAVLVTCGIGGERDWEVEDTAQELRSLALSTSVVILEEMIFKRDAPTPNFFIGKGKAEEAGQFCRDKGADVVIFGNDLSATQQRNLEELWSVKVIDRTQLILDIFAQRAKSTEGKYQVELAQLLYLLPRLSGKGIMLSRLGGGIGTRGPGEQKLEVDRRRIRKRIAKLEEELRSLRERRATARQKRLELPLSTLAIIGYTNVGKSSLFNQLTDSREVSEDRLFSTLDPVARKCVLQNHQRVIFLDTVGFLKDLPHHLIESFQATLEEVVEADILIHVLDVTHPKIREQGEAVYKVLRELKVGDKPIILCLNKVDQLVSDSPSSGIQMLRLKKDFPEAILLSARTGEGIDKLFDRIVEMLQRLITKIAVLLPHSQMGYLDLIYSQGVVTKREDRAEGVYLEAEIPIKVKDMLKGLPSDFSS